MCGFAGCFRVTSSVDPSRLEAAVQALRHRGPDGQGIWVDPERVAGLAHTRLGLVDLSPTGAQPLVSEDGRLALVHNGEFYDFAAWRQRLAAQGWRFRSATDSEVLMPLFDLIGAAALSQLRGEFAFALWDRRQRQVFAARDRFGIKPLFYALHDGALFLASEVKAIFAMGVPARWDVETVYRYHQTRLLPSHRTLFQGVYQVPPGHHLTASASAGFADIKVRAYWDLDFPAVASGRPAQRGVQAAVRRIRARFEDAVRTRLCADVPVACYLSGGLDSSSVLGVATRFAPYPIHTFTVRFVDDATHDESAQARAVATAYGTVHHEVAVTGKDLVDNLVDSVRHSEAPALNSHGAAKLLLSKAVHDAGFRAVLTGEGSDEIFAGYTQLWRDADAATASPAADPTLACVERALGYVPAFVVAGAHAAELGGPLLREEFRSAHAGYDAWRAFLDDFDLPRQLWGRERLNQSLYLWSKTMLPHYMLCVLGDRMEMANAVEGRLPFLDHPLVEEVARLPAAWKATPDREAKHILREAMRPYLPASVRRRPKRGFVAPPAACDRASPLGELAQDIFRSRSFAASPFYAQRDVLALIDQLPRRPREHWPAFDREIMTALSVHLLGQTLGLTAA